MCLQNGHSEEIWDNKIALPWPYFKIPPAFQSSPTYTGTFPITRWEVEERRYQSIKVHILGWGVDSRTLFLV